MAVAAQFDRPLKSDSKRGTARHQVRLRISGAPAMGDVSDVLIHNLSTSGLLLESAVHLAIGDRLVMDLPEAPGKTAKVTWAGGQLFGCAFDNPLSAAAISAAQLRSKPMIPLEQLRDDGTREGDKASVEAFGTRLKRLRKEKGLTLVELARRMNVSRPTIWAWEASKSTPRPSKSKDLPKALGVTENELFGASASPERHTRETKAPSQGGTVRRAIDEAKERIAEEMGTTPDRVTLIIEV